MADRSDLCDTRPGTAEGGQRPSAVAYSDEAETSCLGAALLNSHAAEILVGALDVDHFYRHVHGEIFRAIRELLEQGREADPLLVAEHLRGVPEFQQAGGASYLHLLVSAIPIASRVGEYCRIVKGYRVEREIARIADELKAGELQPATAADRLWVLFLELIFRRGSLRCPPAVL